MLAPQSFCFSKRLDVRSATPQPATPQPPALRSTAVSRLLVPAIKENASFKQCSSTRRDKGTRCSAASSLVVKDTAIEDTLSASEEDLLAQTLASSGGLITREAIRELEAHLDKGPSIAALRRFNSNLRNLSLESWEDKLRHVMTELAYNLESFNPAFTAVLLKVQMTIGVSDYEARDQALKLLINPLAGEYGMYNGYPQGKTHRELFAEFYEDLFKEPLGKAMRDRGAAPEMSVHFFHKMEQDIMGGGGFSDPLEQASYALGYNLAIEYLADYEKTWMLDSFRDLNQRVLQAQGRPLTRWDFLEVHAEGEAEHAAIGHGAAACFVPRSHAGVLRKAMADHDRDFAAFYNALADMLA
eukprot:jgi/Botrbrau1/12786/Bobra.117_1s0005.1